MEKNSSGFGLFLAELKRRHVWRAAIAYAAGSFVLLQLAEIVLPAFEAPDWALRLLVVVTLLGFPVALVLAWVYEITPQGIRRTQDAEGGGPQTLQSGGLLPRIALLAVTLVTVGALGWWVVSYSIDTRSTPERRSELSSTASGASGAPGSPVAYDAETPIRSLAVLPFENFSDDPEQNYFVAGMHEAVVSQLSQLGSVRVISRTSVAQYAGTTKTAPQIARELGVEGIVEGSVFRAGDRVRITIQLIHGPSDTHILTREYDRDLTDILALQREVAIEIAREIQAEITPEMETSLASGESVEPEAAEAYMRGRYQASKGTPEGYQQAIQHFEEAVTRDSNFVAAYTGLAGAQLLLELSAPDSTLDLEPAIEAATRAVKLDSSSPEARAILSEITRYNVRLADSLRGLVQIVGVGVDSAVMPGEEWAMAYSEFSREAERVALSREMAARRSLAPDRRVRAARYLAIYGQDEEAETFLRQALEADPTLSEAWDLLQRLYVMRGDLEGAVEVYAQRVREGDRVADAAGLANLRRAVAENGASGYWEWRLHRLDEREAAGVSISHVDYAAALIALGRHEAALTRLERAYDERDRRLYSLVNDPLWDSIRGDPRFLTILERMRRPPPPAPVPEPGR
ncbi:MAG: hypothetical protein GWN99_16570 [Gemmatimonadetes bacterium]|uniref:Tetratricopeptide repeat protein n=1 Tax=Candidatus Kutchimonas denitrificans TaxID=3056748 RepID=A0AAE5CBC7_9BACT|nr:hypothetical protein [Gemmatimonadota bacterium]NIR74403.1 hypothetical protein [Candidatus Kutchimonas denitrificans]NIS02654.1 hypothetical protein [Gemmatimonadota bacterium]NIT68529.1 hypothetical protein [Gemmatimonadota bacterium]NIU52006.1 hypothetical protein [Gemmatimonadota bacterium]